MTKSLKEVIAEAEGKRTALGHFNISELSALKAIFEAARESNLPIIIGVSDGERDFIGARQTAALIKSLREEYNYPIFLNADHAKSLERIEEAAQAGFDAVLFDGGRLPLKENIKLTAEAVVRAKFIKPDILVEGELGFIGGPSAILKEIPRGAAIQPEDLTKPDEAAEFVEKTKIDLLAPAVGNLHGMFKDMPNPNLNIERIREIKAALRQASLDFVRGKQGKALRQDLGQAGVPLVLHGGSGIRDEDFLAAIDAGISVIHINTEIRFAWRQGIERALKEKLEEIAPYKILSYAVEEMKKVVYNRLKLFNKISE